MVWGRNAVANNVPAGDRLPALHVFGSTFPAYKGLMMAISVAMFVFLYARAQADAHRPRDPGGADASADGERARPRRAGRVRAGVRGRQRARRARRRDRRLHAAHAADAGARGRADRVRRRRRRRAGVARRRADRVDADRHPADLRGGGRLFAARTCCARSGSPSRAPRRSTSSWRSSSRPRRRSCPTCCWC